MTGVPVGRVAWFADINDTTYTTSANGKAAGIISILVSGDGNVVARGNVVDGILVPTDFTSDAIDDGVHVKVQMTFDKGTATGLTVEGPKPDASQVPVTDEDRRDIFDPLTAMLIPVNSGTNGLTGDNCERVLRIFDGRRRYDLALSFLRIEKTSVDRGYSGPALVCSFVLKPVAGHRPDSMLIKYVANRRDMELWFAPIAGTSVMAPVRVVVPTFIGAVKIQAEVFEATATAAPAVAPAVPKSEN
jgi:hypothetical protein